MIIAVNFQIYAIGRKKPKKYQGFNRIRTRDLRDTGAMLDQLGCEASLSSTTTVQYECHIYFTLIIIDSTESEIRYIFRTAHVARPTCLVTKA